MATRLHFHQNAMGAVPGPFDCFLTQRGAKTLGVRMDRHCDNAGEIVTLPDRAPKVSRSSTRPAAHPGHEVAARQMRRFGGMVAFRRATAAARRSTPARRTEC